MEMITQDPIHQPELNLFSELKDIKVVFDVGARTDLDYVRLKPGIECHLFEPCPEFFGVLQVKVQEENLDNIHLNNFGLSDKPGELRYNVGIQSFRNSDMDYPGDRWLPIDTLDWYCKENKIKAIDFLKTDTEGFDYKVLVGGKSMWPKIKYIQYEHWNDDERYRELLKDYFDFEYTGYRNGFCMNKNLVSEEERARLVKYIRDNKMAELV